MLHQFWPFETETPTSPRACDLPRVDGRAGRHRERAQPGRAGWRPTCSYTGLRAAGPEFTRQGVIDFLNSDDYDADGLSRRLDWTIEHDRRPARGLQRLSIIEDGEFVPAFGEPGKPFICFPNDAEELPDEPEVSA